MTTTNTRQSTTCKHTPGPWKLDDDGYRIKITSDSRKGKCGIASIDIGFDEPFESEQKANARLIAAAPELLEALKWMDEYLDNAPTLREIARAAIAKAEGEPT